MAYLSTISASVDDAEPLEGRLPRAHLAFSDRGKGGKFAADGCPQRVVS